MSTSSVSIPVPASGFGVAVDVSMLVGEKTVSLSGRYRGAYVLYGSHDGVRFAPLLIFNAGGIEGIKQTFRGAFASLKLKSLATGAVGVSANASGLSAVGDNSFTSLASGTALDLGNDAYQVDLNFMGFGSVNGAVVVEGSLDGIGYNPIGEFASTQVGVSLLGGGSGIEFSPVTTTDRVRYVRLNVQGNVGAGFVVTVGGAQSSGSGGSETLAVAYAAGVASVDQTLVLEDSRGGKVIFDASDAGFTDSEVFLIRGVGGTIAAFYSDGGMELNDVRSNISIGTADQENTNTGSFNIAAGYAVGTVGDRNVVAGFGSSASGNDNAVIQSAIAIGNRNVVAGMSSNSVGGGDDNVVIGYYAQTEGSVSDCVVMGTQSSASDDQCVVIGYHVNSLGGYSVNIGSGSSCEGECEVFIGFGNTGGSGATNCVLVGRENRSGDGTEGCFMVGRGNATGVGASFNFLFGETNSAYSQYGLIEGFNSYSNDQYQIVFGTGSKGESLAPGAVILGHGARAGNSITLPSSMNAIATGTGAVVEGDEGMAFGTGAFAGAGEIVFSSGSVGGANRFEVVASTTGNPDLFSFDVSLVGSANTTAFTLLVTKDDGLTTASLPVTLSTPDPITHMSNLQVLNN